MKKIAAVVTLSIGLSFSSLLSTSHADTTTPSTELTLDQIQNVVANNPNAEIVSGQDLPSGTPIVQLSSQDDLQNYLTTLDNNEIDPTVTDVSDDGLNAGGGMHMLPLSTAHTGSKVLSWYAPWSGSIVFNSAFLWKNIDFTYNYHYNSSGGRVFNYITPSNITSYISGMYTADWHQTSSDHSYYDSMRGVKFTINGYYLFGVAYGGSTVGIRESDTWSKSYHF
jgi:hypothetical protein